MTQPSFKQTSKQIYGIPIVLAVGDTTYLDYKKILEKRDDYGPTGNGGNGLILHTSLALDPDFSQPLGLLWEKLWHRQHKASLQVLWRGWLELETLCQGWLLHENLK